MIDYDTYEITSSCGDITTWYNIYGDWSEFNLGRGKIATLGKWIKISLYFDL